MSQFWPGSPADPFASNSTSGPDPAPGSSGSTRLRPRTPRRSLADRKLAGVAGGIGRALGIDPLLIRVAFVVLTIFGGFGALLYVLAWLLMPADGDNASAAQALLGRGRSSVPPALAVVLAVFAAMSLFSTVFWGFPFLPFLIVGVIALIVMKRRRRWSRWDQWGQSRWQDWNSSTHGWDGSTDSPPSSQTSPQPGCGWGGRPGRGGWSQYWGGPISDWTRGWTGQSSRRSPFERPAFWEHPSGFRSAPDGNPGPSTDQRGPATSPTAAGPTVDMTKPRAGRPDTGPDLGSAADSQMPRTTPPAWDPLGAAPFAWDLPEPTPVEPSQPAAATPAGRVLTRVTLGAALFASALVAAAILAGWKVLPWAWVSATALAVLGVGLLISALRGRGYALVGPGVFLSLVTLALTTTGLTGTTNYGDQYWSPTTTVDLKSSYEMQAGSGHLDLSKLTLAAGQTESVTLQVNAGRAEVDLPAAVAANVTCKTLTGHVDCNGEQAGGFNRQVTSTTQPPGSAGTLNLVVEVRAGEADVRATS